ARERDLAGQVDVVGAGGDARLDDRLAVARVRADEVDDGGGPRRHLPQGVRSGYVRGDRGGRFDALLGEDLLDLAQAPPGGGAARGGVGPGWARRDAPAGDARRPEGHDVEGTRAHGREPYPRLEITSKATVIPAASVSTSRGSESRPGTKLWWNSSE